MLDINWHELQSWSSELLRPEASSLTTVSLDCPCQPASTVLPSKIAKSRTVNREKPFSSVLKLCLFKDNSRLPFHFLQQKIFTLLSPVSGSFEELPYRFFCHRKVCISAVFAIASQLHSSQIKTFFFLIYNKSA